MDTFFAFSTLIVLVGEGHGGPPGAPAPLERVRAGDGLGADGDAAHVGDLVGPQRVDGVAEHVDAAEHRWHLRLGEALAAGGGPLRGELGVAQVDADRAAVDPAELLVDELHGGLHRLAQLGVGARRGVLLVHHAEHDRFAGGLGGRVGDVGPDGGPAGAGQQRGPCVQFFAVVLPALAVLSGAGSLQPLSAAAPSATAMAVPKIALRLTLSPDVVVRMSPALRPALAPRS